MSLDLKPLIFSEKHTTQWIKLDIYSVHMYTRIEY